MTATADVPAAFPASLSPSRANDFMTCPLLFRLRTIDRLPEEPGVAALRGTLVHTALEHMFEVPAGERSVEAVRALLRQAWVGLAAEHPDEAAVLAAEAGVPLDAADPAGTDTAAAEAVADAILAPALPLLDAYFALEDPSRLDPHAREMGIAVEITDGFTIRGFIDRIDRAPDGAIRIVDYKTGKSPAPGFEGKAMFQMRFYALAWWRLTGEIPKQLQLLYLGNTERLRYEPTEDDLLGTERKVLALREAIAKAAETGTFAPSPSRLCDWCSFTEFCPAKGGTTPPLPPREEWVRTTSPADALTVEITADADGG